MRYVALDSYLWHATLVCLVSVSCAKMADPQPPNLTPPATIEDLRLELQENHIVLDFSVPSTYVDGQPLELQNVAVYRMTLRRTDQPPPVTAAEMEQSGQVIKKLWPEDLKTILQGGRYRFLDVVAFPDRNLIFQRSFLYAVRFYSPRRVGSAFSKMAFVSPRAPAAAPEITSARADEAAVLLEWRAPAGNLDGSVPPRVVGYRVFRGAEKELSMLAEIEGDVRRFSDSGTVPEQNYYYAVQTRSADSPPAFGPLSRAIAVSTADVFPPAVPQGLRGLVSAGRVGLVWEPNSEIDLQGYNVYRSDALEGTFQKISASPAVVNSWSDTPPARGHFFFRVTGVDRKGNESASSASVGVDFE